MLPREAAGLPMAQTIWYIPTGLDIWNQKILKAPGHYARGGKLPPGPPPAPVVHWPDQAPERLEARSPSGSATGSPSCSGARSWRRTGCSSASWKSRSTGARCLPSSSSRGSSTFRTACSHNRSYTTGHKAYRARSTVELGDAIGWDRAHAVLYAGALDMAVGPRWYSTYEMACNAITVYIEEDRISAIPYSGTTERERAPRRQ